MIEAMQEALIDMPVLQEAPWAGRHPVRGRGAVRLTLYCCTEQISRLIAAN